MTHLQNTISAHTSVYSRGKSASFASKSLDERGDGGGLVRDNTQATLVMIAVRQLKNVMRRLILG